MYTKVAVRTALLTAVCAGVLFVGSTGAAADAVDENRTLALEREPVEFTALDSGDQHIEVVFDEPIDESDYEYVIRDGDDVVAEPEVNHAFSDPGSGRLWLDLGDTDLSGDGVTLVLEAAESDAHAQFEVTTTDGFVQHDSPEETAVTGDERIAVVNLQGTTPVDLGYDVLDGDGETVASGSTGDETFVSVADADWAESGTYSVAFETGVDVTVETEPAESNDTGSSPSSVDAAGGADADAPDDEWMPSYVESRQVESVTDLNAFEPGTTIKFRHGLGMAEVVLNSSDHIADELVIDELDRVPPQGVRTEYHDEIEASEPPDDVVTIFNLYFEDGTEPATLRVPVFVGQEDYDGDDLRMVHYENGSWNDLNATVVDDAYFDGYHMVTLEGHANSTSLFAVVADE